MKDNITIPHRPSLRHTAFKAAACATTLAALLALATTARAQSADDFNSGSDAAWSHITDSKYPYTITFVPDATGGYAYRMQATGPANPTDKRYDTARVAAVRTDTTYTDFYVAADLVDWNQSTYQETNDVYIGLIARASSIDNGLMTGVAMLFAINYKTQHTNANSVPPTPERPSTGLTATGWIKGGDVATFPAALGGTGVVPSGLAYLTLDSGHRYRLILQGSGSGSTCMIKGLVYDLQDLTRPLITISGDASAGAIYGPVPASGYSGLVVANASTNSGAICDVTFDNFVAAAAPPTSVSEPAVPHGLAGAPQVVNRTPASWTNFYSYASGISFTATTLTTTNNLNTNAIRLILNGVDVSSGLSITPTSPPTNATVTFSGLTSNIVYDASIILQDVNGHNTTNVWTFDTFIDAFLASAPCLNIECEDYDYESGKRIDNAALSGFSTNDNFNTTGYVFPYPDDGSGYVMLRGVEGVDFHDWSDTPHYGSTNLLSPDIPSCEYRVYGMENSGDPVGVAQGTPYDAEIRNFSIGYGRRFDTRRQKYVDTSAAAAGYYSWEDPNFCIEEYLVTATEGGEWLDYTRTNFNGSYNVYLRHGCAITEPVSLSQLGGPNTAPTSTNLLGTFYGTNACMWNYRYATLLDATGKPAAVSLTGTKTLRLEMAASHGNSAAYGMALNYLAFVPVSQGSLQVNITPAGAASTGQWQIDGGTLQSSGATVSSLNPGLHTISFTSVTGYASPTNTYVNIAPSGNTLTANYIALGPKLWSTAQVKTSLASWTQETATVDTVNKTVTVAQNGTIRFYQLRDAAVQYRVTKVVRSGGNVVLYYQ
jgi:hypothetical protein